MAYQYNRKKDYEALIQNAVKNNRMDTAAVLEQQRNAKILGEGMNQYQTTNRYAQYLPKSGGTAEISQTASRQYEDPYKQQRLQAIQDYQKKTFEYDPEADPQVKRLRENYIAQGQRAMRDTVADVSARTGGMRPATLRSRGSRSISSTWKGFLTRSGSFTPRNTTSIWTS